MSIGKGKFEFSGARYGLNTNDPAFSLLPGEAAELLNFQVLRNGSIETFRPVARYNTTALASSAKRFSRAPIAGTVYEFITNAAYGLHYLSTLTPTSIGTLAGHPYIIAYAGYAVIMDGSYLKYLSGVSGIKMAYDTGTGTSGYQYNNLLGVSASSLALGNGTITRVAQKFTSQAWDAGYTIPPTTVTFQLTKTGSPTGAITVKLRKVSDDSVLATKTLIDAGTLTGTEEQYSVTFSTSDITTEMSPATAYYLTLEYAGGGVTDYVNVHTSTVGSGGLSYTYAGSYSADTTKNCIAGLRPGRPPKASSGLIKGTRLFIKDPDNLGIARYSSLSSLNSLFDWSTTGYAGYVGIIDDNANNYKMGAMVELYGDIYFFGTEDQPYLCKLNGTTPSDYAVASLSQPVWTTQKCVQACGNDIWFVNSNGVFAISGVQEFGDLRVNPYSSSVQNKFPLYWDSATAFTGYYNGLFFLCMPSYHRVLVFHTKVPVRDPSGIGARYPISEWERVRDDFTHSDYTWVANSAEWYLQKSGGDPGIDDPDFVVRNGKKITEGTAGSLTNQQWDYALDPSSTYYTIYYKDSLGSPTSTGITLKSVIAPQDFYTSGSDFFMCGTDGYAYKVDKSGYKDLSDWHPNYDWRPRYAAAIGNYVTVFQQQVIAAGTEGGQFDFEIYKNDSQMTPAKSTTLALSINDTLTIEELTGDVEDAYYLVDPQGAKNWKDIRVTGYSFQPRIRNLKPSGKPIIIMGCLLQYWNAET